LREAKIKDMNVINNKAHFYIPITETKEKNSLSPIRPHNPEDNFLEKLNESLEKLNNMRTPDNKLVNNIEDFRTGLYVPTKAEELIAECHRMKIRKELGIEPKIRNEVVPSLHYIENTKKKAKRNLLKDQDDEFLRMGGYYTARNSYQEPNEISFTPRYESSTKSQEPKLSLLDRKPQLPSIGSLPPIDIS
jgi:hypothetical protein